MISEKERQNREELFRLMRENPDLPVVAMVDEEVVPDDSCGRWMGSWGSSCIEEYFVGKERTHFREKNDFDAIEEALTDGVMCYEDYENMSDEEAIFAYEHLLWVKAIVVNIDLP